MRRFDLYKHKFDIEDINLFIESPIVAPLKGLNRGTGNGIGNGIGNGNGIKGGMGEKENPESNENDIYPFEEFWNDYEKKVGKKDKLIPKWNKLSDADKIKIREYIPHYKIAQPNKQYRKNPETFINNKSWNDEIISNDDKRNTITRKHGIDDDYKRSVLSRLQNP